MSKITAIQQIKIMITEIIFLFRTNLLSELFFVVSSIHSYVYILYKLD